MTEISAVADKYEDFTELGAEVLSISVDSVHVHKSWNENEIMKTVDGGVPFPMLSDSGGRTGTLYGVYDEEKGIENRGRFIIDPDGIVQAYEVLAPPVGRSVSEMIRQLEAFRLVREKQDREATPVGWKPGGKTLKPGPDLVGRVHEVWKLEEE